MYGKEWKKILEIEIIKKNLVFFFVVNLVEK